VLDGVFNATNSEPILYLFVCGLTLLPIHIGDGMNLIDLRVRIQPSKNGTRDSANSFRDYFDQFLEWFAQTGDIFDFRWWPSSPKNLLSMSWKYSGVVLSMNGTPGRGSISIRQPAMTFATALPELSADIGGERKMKW